MKALSWYYIYYRSLSPEFIMNWRAYTSPYCYINVGYDPIYMFFSWFAIKVVSRILIIVPGLPGTLP